MKLATHDRYYSVHVYGGWNCFHSQEDALEWLLGLAEDKGLPPRVRLTEPVPAWTTEDGWYVQNRGE